MISSVSVMVSLAVLVMSTPLGCIDRPNRHLLPQWFQPLISGDSPLTFGIAASGKNSR
jgi:hypothetical protein